MDHVSSERQHDADGRSGRRPLKRWLLLALALVATLGFTGLGVWQVERRAWKLDLIARVDARVHAPPVAVPWGGDPKTEEYRHVTVSGTFDHGKETFVQALTERGAGFWVLTPLATPQGTVLVNRGFVPPDKSAGMARPSGTVTITGLLRASEPGGTLLRANAPAEGRWYSRDVAAIAAARGLGRVAPFFIDAEARCGPGDYPVGGLTVVVFRNNHLVYAITWFGLAMLSAAGMFLLLRRRGVA